MSVTVRLGCGLGCGLGLGLRFGLGLGLGYVLSTTTGSPVDCRFGSRGRGRGRGRGAGGCWDRRGGVARKGVKAGTWTGNDVNRPGRDHHQQRVAVAGAGEEEGGRKERGAGTPTPTFGRRSFPRR